MKKALRFLAVLSYLTDLLPGRKISKKVVRLKLEKLKTKIGGGKLSECT
jgi:hypothetical protein